VKTPCDVQYMTKEIFDKVMKECSPEEADEIQQGIRKEMALKAESLLGLQRGTTEVLKLSAIFRSTSEAFTQRCYQHLTTLLYQPGEDIMQQ